MPLYEYWCQPEAPHQDEAHPFEVLQVMAVVGLAVCPTHGIESRQRLVSLPAPQAGAAQVTAGDIRQELYGRAEVPTLDEVRRLAQETLRKGQEVTARLQAAIKARADTQ